MVYFHILFDLEPIAVVFYEPFHTAFRKKHFANYFPRPFVQVYERRHASTELLGALCAGMRQPRIAPMRSWGALPKPLWTAVRKAINLIVNRHMLHINNIFPHLM